MTKTEDGAPKREVTFPLKQHGRYDYIGINDRPTYSWPNGSKLAVYLMLNTETFAYSDGNQNASLMGPRKQPDVSSHGWKDYGNRVAAWRMLEMFNELGLKIGVLLNTETYTYHPELVAAYAESGHDIVGHGRTNSEYQENCGSVEEETALIREATDAIIANEGKHPEGWLGPGLSETEVSLDLLKEAGYKYVMDWCTLDDQPTWMTTRAGKILAVPYALETNDFMAMKRQHSPATYAELIIDTFDEMLRQSNKDGRPLVMCIALHTFIAGYPNHLKHLRRALEHIVSNSSSIWLTTAREIAGHVEQLRPGTVPGDGTFVKNVTVKKRA